MKTKTLKTVFASLFLFGLTLFVRSPQAFAATKTWDGGGSDNNMNTAANWAGDSAPIAGDDLVFPAGAARQSITNNYSGGTSFNSITFSGSSTNDAYTISGNSLALVAGITSSMTGNGGSHEISAALTLSSSQTFNVSSNNYLIASGSLALGSSDLIISGSGDADLGGTITGTGSITSSVSYLFLTGDNSSYSGAIAATSGSSLYAYITSLGTTGGTTTINSGADLHIGSCSDTTATVNENIVLNGASSWAEGDSAIAKLTLGATCTGGGGGGESFGRTSSNQEYILAGTLSLGSDATFGPLAKKTTITGAISGAYAINSMPGWSGTLIVDSSSNGSNTPNGTYTPPVLTKTLSDDQASTSVNVKGNTTIIVTGKRGDISLSGAGAILKGTGTVGAVSASNGAKVSPGLSPGCLSSGGVTFASGVIYEAELGGTTACSGYDQLKVTGTVDLGSSTLSTSLYNNFKPAKGNTFTIIDNDGSDAITGTFANLAEGATFSISGYVFKISYVGGSGNDVALTVQSVPAAPDTGSALLRANPLVSLFTASVCAVGILGIARYQKRLSSK